MEPTIATEKAVLRQSVKHFYLSDGDRSRSDQLLFALFLALPQVEQAHTLFLYYGAGMEPDTAQLIEPLLQRGKVIALPCCRPQGVMEFRQYMGPQALQKGSYDIPEPDETCPPLVPGAGSLLLVPALCCDRRGFRLGHGGGYYDRYLTRHTPYTVALCRGSLLLDSIPAAAHDRQLDLILTERERLSFS